MKTRVALLLLTVCYGLMTSIQAQNCETTNESLQKCIKMAEPLIKNSQNVFPSTNAEITHVCNNLFPRTWSDFIACVKKYTDNCLNSDEKTDFNRAVGDSINVVHRMCTNEDYKKEYMKHAYCIRDRATNVEHCGRYYQSLLDRIASATSSPSEICCAHSKFKYCVLEKTEYCQCDNQKTCFSDPLEKSKANTFARATLDKALGFLLKQCDSVGFGDCKSVANKESRRIVETHSEGGHKDFDGYFPSGGRIHSDPPPITSTRTPQPTTSLKSRSSFSPSLIDDNLVDSSTLASVSEISSVGPKLSSTPSYVLPSEPNRPPQETDRSRPTWYADSPEIQDFDDFFEDNDVFRYQLSAQELEQQGNKCAPGGRASFLLASSITIIFLSLFL